MAQVLSPGQVLEPSLAPQVEEEWRQNLNVHMMCPDCREWPPNIVEEFSSGDCVCGSCGLVLGDRIIDTRSEWRTFANDESGSDDPSRVGTAANPLFNGSQLETAISFGDGGQRSRELNRAHAKLNQNKSNKNLKEVYQRITAICTPLHLSSDIIDTTSQLYKATEDVKFLKGKNIDAIIAGCLFIACRQMNSPRTFKEINKATRVSKKEIGRTFKVLQSHFSNQKRKAAGVPSAAGNIHVIGEAYQNKSSTKANELVDRYCDALQLSMNTSKVARGIAEKMSATGSLAGRSPLSAAAACIYMASHLMGEPKSPKEIAQVAEVSDGTIRTSYKELFKVADQLIDPVWLTAAYGGDKAKMPPV